MENRKGKRVHFVCQADVVISDHCFRAMCDNLSLNGMFIRTDHQIPVGKMGGISLNLDKAFIASVNCVVVRSDYNGLAVQFKSLDYDSFTHIKALVNRNPSHLYNE